MVKQEANVMALVNVLAHSGILRCKHRGIYPKELNQKVYEKKISLTKIEMRSVEKRLERNPL